jgi:hypothetical protein
VAKRWDVEREREDSSMLGGGGLGRDGLIDVMLSMEGGGGFMGESVGYYHVGNLRLGEKSIV